MQAADRIPGSADSAPLVRTKSLLTDPRFSIRDNPDYFRKNSRRIHSPLWIHNMEKGVALLTEALTENPEDLYHLSCKSILLLGDRDVDGVASTAMMGSFLRERLGIRSDRLNAIVSDAGDDYGLHDQMADRIIAEKPGLVIMLDMGSAHFEGIERLLSEGIAVIVLDHHTVQGVPPVSERLAFINSLNADFHGPLAGKTPTTALVYKFLMAYGMSFVSDWNTVIRLENSEESYSYRLGRLLSEKDIQSDWKIRKVDISAPNLDPVFRLNARDIELIRKDPMDSGCLILHHQIRYRSDRPRISHFLTRMADLAAIGIISDMVPLIDENRAIARIGMGIGSLSDAEEYIKSEERYRPGYRALLKQLRISDEKLSSRDMGWSVAPAINAAGRMGRTELALKLLMSSDEEEAAVHAKALSDLNKQRKNRTKKNEKTAAKLFEENPEILSEPVIFCYHEDLEPGVSGIAANRLAEEYKKPVIYINPDGDYARGSARSFGQCGILNLVASGADLLIQHGGHREAAGFSIRYENIPLFRERILESAKNLPELSIFLSQSPDSESEPSVKAVPVNEEIPEFHITAKPEDLLWSVYAELQLMEPFGMANPEPVFYLPGVRIHSVKHLSEGKHARFRIQGAPNYTEALIWRQGHLLDEKKASFQKFDLWGCLEYSFFSGKKTLQFRVEALRPC